MRLAFYAPLKAPDHPTPSGDRRMARALASLGRDIGYEVDLVSRFRSYERTGDAARQLRLRALGTRLASRIEGRLRGSDMPGAWMTYHCYHKAPDWLGPSITDRLGMPYLIAEASIADKQAGGPWEVGHRGALAAIQSADMLLAMTRDDAEGLGNFVRPPAEVRIFPPFLNLEPFQAAGRHRAEHRARLAQRLRIPENAPWLLTVAMMRADVKRLSYLALADALSGLCDQAWVLLTAGDGEAGSEIRARLDMLGSDRVRHLGALPETELPSLYSCADLLVWPAFREAYGLALLEAQAAGVPIVACDEGGVPEVVRDGETGLLVRGRDPTGFRDAVRMLLDEPDRRRAMSVAAREHVRMSHDADAAGSRLRQAIEAAVSIRSRRRAEAAE